MKACADVFVSIIFSVALGMSLIILLLLSACTCSVVFSDADGEDAKNEIDTDVWNEMVKTNTIVCVQAYPNTPVGFLRVYHYDIETAIGMVLGAVKESRGI